MKVYIGDLFRNCFETDHDHFLTSIPQVQIIWSTNTIEIYSTPQTTVNEYLKHFEKNRVI